MRIAILGDIHLGNNKDNPIFHNIALDYGKWVIESLSERKVDKIIQVGDVFHHRTSINLSTLNAAHQFFELFDGLYPIEILCGNHDSYYSSNCSLHSLSLLKNWKGIEIIDKLHSEEGITICPWGTKIEDIPDSRIIFGHFEVLSFEMSKGKLCEHGMKGTELMDKCEVLFSGHFHKPQMRTYKNKPLYYTGSCYQLNWGESGEDKYFYILDTETLQVERIKNTVSPRFEYIHTDADIPNIKNNFISVLVNNTEKGKELIDKYNLYSPLGIKTEYNEKKIVVEQQLEEFNATDVTKDIKEYCLLLPNLLEEEQSEVSEGVNDLYNQFM